MCERTLLSLVVHSMSRDYHFSSPMTSSVTSNLLTFLVPNMQRREDVSTVEGYLSVCTTKLTLIFTDQI